MGLSYGIGTGIPFIRSSGLSLISQYRTVYNAFGTEPSNTDALIQNTMMKSLVNGGYYAKAELIDVFATPTSEMVNWKSPGTFNPALVNAPSFEAYKGFTGAATGDKSVRLNFNPSANGTLISQNSVCIIVGIGTDVASTATAVGAYDGTNYLTICARRPTTNKFRAYCNNASYTEIDNANSIGHHAISRGAAASYDIYKNTTKTNTAKVSAGVPNVELYACALNSNGTILEYDGQIRYVWVSSYLTEAEVVAVMGIFETYLDNYGAGLI